MNDNVRQIRDFLNLECSLFTITKKCFKKCLKLNFVKDKQIITPKELFNLSKNSFLKQEYENFFLECINSCSRDFIISRRFTKEKLMLETDQVIENNQKLYDGYYSEKNNS